MIKIHEYRVDLTPEGSTARRGLATATSQEFGPIWRSANGQLGKSCATVQVRIQNRSAQRKLRVRMPPAHRVCHLAAVDGGNAATDDRISVR